MSRSRADIERDLAQARRYANEPINSFEDRHVERDIVRQYERELANHKEPEPSYNWGGWKKKEEPKPTPRPVVRKERESITTEDEEDLEWLNDGECPFCEEILDWQSSCYDADYSAYCSCGRWTGFVDRNDNFIKASLEKGKTFFN